MSPNGPSYATTGGRKLLGGGPGSSPQPSMNHVYMNLKDDLIEHFDFEAVNQ